jgi:hypothetical protein
MENGMDGLNLKDYGIQEGKLEAAAIQRVIDETDRKRLPVIVPGGCWVPGTLNLRSTPLPCKKARC